MSITLIVLCAGNSSRFELNTKKQWLRIKDEPLWLNVTNRFSGFHDFEKVIVVGHEYEVNYMKNFSDDFTFVTGGSTRQESMKNALQEVTSRFVMVTDVARACVPQEVFTQLINNKEKASCIVPAVKVPDTVIYENMTINRESVKLIQTPQLSNSSKLKEALETELEFTDDSSAVKAAGGDIYYVEGSKQSEKLTFGGELEKLKCLEHPSKDFFTGIGIDIHQFEEGKQMVLGGVQIESNFGFKAHSDGDVLIHSIIDALLGACGAGDIGEFFPDNDPQYKGADSKELLKHIVTFIHNVGYEIVNVDTAIMAQVPKINPHKQSIKKMLSELLKLPKYKINIKATTGEKMGFVGRSEGVAVQSVVTLKYFDWTKEN